MLDWVGWGGDWGGGGGGNGGWRVETGDTGQDIPGEVATGCQGQGLTWWVQGAGVTP